MSDCPTEEKLAGYLAGACAEDDAGRIRAHVTECERCASRVADAEANEAIFDSVRGVLRQGAESAERRKGADAEREESGDARRGYSHPLIVIEGFEILEEIGRGGMGVVYKAQEKDPPRTVALKVLLEGPFASEASKRRFEREVELAAQLEHPNIVTMLESGIASGRHYFVMQLVDGRRLDEYMVAHDVSIDDKLRLFSKICQAVNYAHQRGIIHRDLKPSNILIDQDGAPKILDFGLAKVVDPDEPGAGPTLLSLTGQVMGTLPYMSPEQATGALRDIDIRTDVYSLGVILYEMLTGEYPYKVVGQMADVLKNIVEAEPKKPSTIRRQINDEVETIVLKALAKEKERRYQSAEALGRDVGQYLRGEAIDAKRDSGWYVFKKTVRRYKAPVAVVVAFVAVLGAASVVSRIQYSKAEAARAETAHERDKAIRARNASDKARTDADAVTDYLADWLSSVDPEKQGIDVTLREMLDQASKTIGEKFADKPLIEARLRHTIGWTYRGLGLYDKAEGHLADAAVLYRREKGPRHPNTLSALNAFAVVLVDRGDYTSAAARFKAVFEIRRRVLGEEHNRTLESMNNLAGALLQIAKYAEAEAMYRKALEIQHRVLGEEHPLTLRTMSNMALVLGRQGKYVEAEELSRRTLAIRRRVQGEEHPRTLISMERLAGSLGNQGKYAESEALFRKTLQIRRRVLGPEHPRTLHQMSSLARVLFNRGEYAEAEELSRRTLAIQRRVLGDEHPATLDSMSNLAVVLESQGKNAEAEELGRKTLEIRRRVLGDEHPDTLLGMAGLCIALRRQGNYAEAEELGKRTLEDMRRVLGDEHPNTLSSMNNLAVTLGEQGKDTEAEALFRKTLNVKRRVLGEEHPSTLVSMNNVADALSQKGKYAEAEALYRKTLSVKRRVLGKEHPSTLVSMARFLDMLNSQDKPAEARVLVEELIEYRRRGAGNQHAAPEDLDKYASLLLTVEPKDLRNPRTALPLAHKAVEQTGEENYAMLNTLALAYQMTGDIDQAVETQRKALALLPPDPTPLRTKLETKLGEYLVEQGGYVEAEPLLLAGRKALAAREYVKPDDTKEAIERLIKLYEAWHEAEPDEGHDAQAAEWHAKLAGEQ